MKFHRALIPFLLLSTGLWFARAETSVSDGQAPAIHGEGHDALVLSIYRMYIAEDYDDIRATMRRLEDNCRELKVEEREFYGSDVTDYDRTFHKALDRSRELASRGEWDDSERQFSWVVRTCIECHRVSREAGHGPAVPLPRPEAD